MHRMERSYSVHFANTRPRTKTVNRGINRDAEFGKADGVQPQGSSKDTFPEIGQIVADGEP